MLFIVITGAMLCIAAACVVVPLWRQHPPRGPTYEVAYRSAHAYQVDELARDLAAGRLATSDHAGAQRDLERELVSGLEAGKVRTPLSEPVGSRNRLLAVSAGVILFAGMAVGYWQLGNWRVAVEGVPAATTHSMDVMVAHLSRRLHTQDPNDLQGWTMLGHAYMLMGRYGNAADALDHARRLAGDSDPDLLASYAEAVTLADPDQFMQKAAPLFEKILQVDPNNVRALWYGGLAALNNGDKQLAVQRWNRLLAQNLPAQYETVVKQAIVEAGGTPVVENTVPSGDKLRVDVSLDPALRTRVSPEDVIFVYVEPSNGVNGPPLAARRIHVRDLPIRLTFDEKDQMIGGRRIQDYANGVVVARVSFTGSPTAKAGDLIGKADWARSNKGKVISIKIDASVPSGS
jgi:cytochrome c-type biogenesis protein CcmH